MIFSIIDSLGGIRNITQTIEVAENPGFDSIKLMNIWK